MVKGARCQVPHIDAPSHDARPSATASLVTEPHPVSSWALVCLYVIHFVIVGVCACHHAHHGFLLCRTWGTLICSTPWRSSSLITRPLMISGIPVPMTRLATVPPTWSAS